MLLSPSAARAATLPAYQPEDVRQICAPDPLLNRPGGAVIGQLAPGSPITITGIGFDRAGYGLLRITRQHQTCFAQIGQLRHFGPQAHRLMPP